MIGEAAFHNVGPMSAPVRRARAPRTGSNRGPTDTLPAESRGRRAELSREHILDVALDLIDREGLGALNMRDLGTLLGASTMSVYRHFRNKADLLDALVDRVIADLLPERSEPTWQAQLRTIGLRVRAAILAHPALAPMMGMEFRRSDVSLRINAEIISRLRSSGLPEAEIAPAYWAVAVYTNGYALLEARRISPGKVRRPRSGRLQRQRRWSAMLEAVGDIPPADVPAAAGVLSHSIDDAQFLFGLDCLIDGMELRMKRQAGKRAQ